MPQVARDPPLVRARPLADCDEVWAYFDSGIKYNPRGFPDRVDLGVVLFEPNPTIASESIMASVVSCGLGQAIGSWDLELVRVWNRSKQGILRTRWVRGAQVYDLIAARGAALHLRTNSYTGRVRFIGDGDQVIRYLNGDDSQLRITVDGDDIGAMIRRGILQDTKGLASCTWNWVPSAENLADKWNKRTVSTRPPRVV